MKIKAYLRVAAHRTGSGCEIAINKRPASAPLSNPHGDPLPTVTIPIELDVPLSLLRPTTAEPIQIDLTGITALKGRVHVIVPDELTDDAHELERCD